jgi:hypothetical protein
MMSGKHLMNPKDVATDAKKVSADDINKPDSLPEVPETEDAATDVEETRADEVD